MDLIGRELGQYRVVGKIGAGGMGEVYLLDLRARQLPHIRTERGFRAAEDLFRQAIRKDPI